MLNHYFLVLVITSATLFAIAVFVYLNGPRNLTNVTYALYSIGVAWWSGLEAVAITTPSPTLALLLWRLSHIGVIFTPIFFVHFVMSLFEDHERHGTSFAVFLSYLVGLGFLFLVATPLFIREVVPKFSFLHFINPGFLYPFFFVAWICWAAYGLLLLFRVYARSTGNRRDQLRFFCWSLLFAYIGGVPNFLPTFNIEIPGLMPFGTYAIPAYALVTTYAIGRHRLMDINLALTRATVFVGAFVLIVGLPLLINLSLISSYSVLPFAVAVIFLTMGVVVFLHSPRTPANRIFALNCLTTVHWQGTWTLLFSTSDPTRADFLVRLGYSGIIFIPVTFYHFVISFTGLTQERRWVTLSYFLGLIFVILLWTTDLFIAGPALHFWGYYPRAGILHPLYLALLTAAATRIFVILVHQIRQEQLPALQKNQTWYTLLSIVAYTFASVDFLVNYGISFYPFGFIFTFVSAILVAYAIIRYRLMDVRVALTRWMIFAMLHALALGIPFAFAVLCRDWLKTLAGEWWWVFPFGVLWLLSSVEPLLYRVLQYHAEERLFRKQRQYQAALRTMSQELIGFADAKSLCNFVGQYVGEQMGLTSSELIIQGNGLGALPPVSNNIPPGIKEVLQRWMAAPSRTESYILVEGLHPEHPDVELRVLRTWMARTGVSAFVPGCLRGELVSSLVLGSKRTGEIFTPEDFEVLEALVRQSALVIKNIELLGEVHMQKRLAEFGELMAAINHEFNNVFAIIGGTLQQLIENPNDPSLKQHLASLQDEILRGQYIIRAASAYRKKHRSPPEPWPLATALEMALTQAQQDAFGGAKPQFMITTAIPHDVEVVGRATIPELVSNCLRCLGWACDSKPGTLHIEVSTEIPMVRLRFAMIGGEDLAPIIAKEGELAPEPGRHGGLYLFLVRLIVTDHQGTLGIESTPGGGTTIIVRLPQEQAAIAPTSIVQGGQSG